MQFIMDNYVWFAVGGIVIIMAIIGYFADKTDFGRKVEEKKEPKIKKEKKPKKEKSVKEPEKIEVEAKGIDELTKSMAETTKEEENTPVTDDLYAPLEATEEELDPTLFEPLVPLSNEIVTEEVEEPTVEETKEEIEPVSTNIELPATDAMATTEEMGELELKPFTPSAIEEPIEESVEETVVPEMQPIEPLKEEPVQIPASEPEATEEDIWKF